MKRNTKVSTAVIRRLPRYYRHLLELQGKGVIRISSSALGKSMGLTASQIRQDLFCFGEFGQQGYGYKVDLLREEIGEILGISPGAHRSGTGGRQLGPGPDGKLQVRQQRLPAPGRFRRGRERGGHHHRRSERVPCGPAGGVSVGPQGQRGPAHPAPEGGPGGGRPAGGRGSPGGSGTSPTGRSASPGRMWRWKTYIFPTAC